MAKVQITLDDELLKRVDEFADENYMSRSGLLAISATQYLNTKDLFKALNKMSLAMQTIADKGEIDEATQKELAEFTRLCSMLGANSTKLL